MKVFPFSLQTARLSRGASDHLEMMTWQRVHMGDLKTVSSTWKAWTQELFQNISMLSMIVRVNVVLKRTVSIYIYNLIDQSGPSCSKGG